MKKPYMLLLAATLATVAIIPMPRPAQADTASTLMIAGAAAAIVGALLVDSNNQPYYVSNGRHVYVSHSTAEYYHSHGDNGHHYSQQSYHGGQHYYGQNDNQQHYNHN